MATLRVPVSPEVLHWAADRSGRSLDELYTKFPKLSDWEQGHQDPTYQQLKRFAKATQTAFGAFFLPEPPVDQLPIPDFRTVAHDEVLQPSTDLLETIYICERRQTWYKQYLLRQELEPLEFIGSATITSDVHTTAQEIGELLSFTTKDRTQDQHWTAALRRLINNIEETGILVMVSGVVGNNTSRRLDPQEFRGFALSDPLAPLIFVNAADTKAAQIFTLIHEVCHLWLGQSGLTDASVAEESNHAIEQWCNEVAAEVLVPVNDLKSTYQNEMTPEELTRLARQFKVSTLVILKRMYAAKLMKWEAYRAHYQAEYQRVLELALRRKSTGGNYYNTQPLRVSRRFAKALINDTYSGHTLHRDAFHLLGTKQRSTFDELGKRLGVS